MSFEQSQWYLHTAYYPYVFSTITVQSHYNIVYMYLCVNVDATINVNVSLKEHAKYTKANNTCAEQVVYALIK